MHSLEISYIKNYARTFPDNVIIVESDADYANACHVLTKQADLPVPLTIWVRQKTHVIWFRDFVAQTNIDDCVFTEKTPRLILAEQWNVSLPEWVDDETVMSQKLLELDISGEHSTQFIDTLLVHFWGPVFRAETIETVQLAEIVKVLMLPESKTHFNTYPVLQRCFQEKLDAWSTKAGKPWGKTICQDLSENPEGLWQGFTLRLLLDGYPQKLLEYVTTPQKAMFLRQIPLNTIKEISLHPVAREQAVTQIEMYFNDICSEITSSNDFQTLLQRVSGRLSQEFELVTTLFDSKQFDASQQDIDTIQQRFKTCPGISAARLTELDKYVKPPRPFLLQDNESWDVHQWLRWTQEEYIPYRHWQTQNRHDDKEVEQTVQRFSDWYVKETTYVSIHHDTERSLVHGLTHWGELIRNDTVSLVLLIDSLPLTYWHIFQEALASVGFHQHDICNRFAPLPSETAYSKPLLVSGTWESSGSKYENLLQFRSKSEWDAKRAVYFQNLKALSDCSALIEPSVLLLNFLLADEVLHSDVESQNSTYYEELFRKFNKVAEAAKLLLEKWQGPPDQFGMYVLTDHGACRILEDEKTSFDSKIIAKLFVNEKYRYARVTPSELGNIPPNLWDFGYKFKRPFSQEDAVYFIPRGHNTVKTAHNQGYMHGGATPEEIIVTTAVFRPTKTSFKELTARFLELKINQKTGKATFYIQRTTTLQIELQNPNKETVEVLRFDVLNPDADLKDFTRPTIPGQTSKSCEVSCYFNKSAQEEDVLILQITYEIAGEEHVIELKTSVEFKSAITGGFSLRDT